MQDIVNANRLASLEARIAIVEVRLEEMATAHSGRPPLTAEAFDLAVEHGTLRALKAYENTANCDTKTLLDAWLKLLTIKTG